MVIEADDAEKDRVVGAMMGAEWPTERRFPDVLVADGGSVTYGDLEFSVRSFGPAESHVDTVWQTASGDLFVGDLVYNNSHAYLADGHAEAWLAALEQLASEVAPGQKLYVGHGPPARPEHIAHQRRYFQAFLTALAETRGMDAQDRERHVLEAIHPLVTSEELLFLTQVSIEPAFTAIHGTGQATVG